jgi:hypothetical protein
MRLSHVASSGSALFALALGFLSPLPLLAEPTAADKSLATQLFKEGRALVDQGKIADGCRKLEESQRLDPGGGTLLNVALCHEKEGRTATAWAEFTEALGLAKKDDRAQRIELAQTHIAALEPTLSRLVIQVAEGADVADLEIKRDGSVIRRAAWGTPMPVDPGEHVVEAAAQGRVAWKHSVTIGAKSDAKTVVVPALDVAPTPPPSAAPTLATTASLPASEPRSVRRSPAGWVAMGFGAVGLGFGTYFGLRAISQQKEADKHCSGTVCFDSYGSGQNGDAIRFANLSTVGFGVGVVGIGIGTILLLTSGGSSSRTAITTSPAVGASLSTAGGELTVSGRW